MLRKLAADKARDEHLAEAFRFLVAGVISNGLGYFVFLFAIYGLGIDYKIAVTVLFAVGMAINFLVNRKWTFKARGSYTAALAKFVVVYLAGYGLNISILTVFVDRFGYSPAWVQLVAIGFLAIYYFWANKFYIHRGGSQ